MLTEDQRIAWCVAARRKKSRVRLCQCGPLSGFLYFMKINLALAYRGLAQVDLPPEQSEAAERAVLSLNYTGKFDQLPVGPALFLHAHNLLGGCVSAPRQLLANAPAPSG